MDRIGKFASDNGIFTIAQRPLTVAVGGDDYSKLYRLSLYPKIPESEEIIKETKSYLIKNKMKAISKVINTFIERANKSTNIFDVRESFEEEVLPNLELSMKNIDENAREAVSTQLSRLISVLEQNALNKGNEEVLEMLKSKGLLDESKISTEVSVESVTQNKSPNDPKKLSLARHSLEYLLKNPSNLSCVLVGASLPFHLFDFDHFREFSNPGFKPREVSQILGENEYEEGEGEEEEKEKEIQPPPKTQVKSSPLPPPPPPSQTPPSVKSSPSQEKQSSEQIKSQRIKDTLVGVPKEILDLARSCVTKKKKGEIPTEQEEKARQILYAKYLKQSKNPEPPSNPKEKSKKSDLNDLINKLSPEQQAVLKEALSKKKK